MSVFEVIKNADTTAAREDACRVFVADMFNDPQDEVSAHIIDSITPKLARCAGYVDDEFALSVIAHGLRNAYYDGMLSNL